MRMNKRGVLQDHFYIMKLLFIVIILLVFSTLMWYNFSDGLTNLDTDIADSSVKADIADLDNIFGFIDKLIPLIFFILWGLVLFFGSKTTPSSPLGLIISLAFLLIISFVSIILTDLGTELLGDSVFTPIVDQISNSLFFVYHFHYITFFFGLLALGFFYNKGVFGGGNIGDEGII